MSRPLFLISNDDGVHAPGVKALREAARKFGDVVVVAPHVEKSATSQAISISTPLRVEKISEDTYAVEGTPADCVMFGLRKVVHRRPDWVLSGINRGGNLGVDTLYSGTVGAALEGALQGCLAAAFSLHGVHPLQYESAMGVVEFFLKNRDQFNLSLGNVLNFNVPNVDPRHMKGIIGAGLGRRIYDEAIVEGTDPRGRRYYWIGGGGDGFENIPDSDCVYIDNNYVTVSVLKADLLDAGANQVLKKNISEHINADFLKHRT